MAPKFSETDMVLECEPVNLNNRYNAVKEAIEKANAAYEEARKAQAELLQKEQDAKDEATKQKAEAEETIRSAFRDLQL